MARITWIVLLLALAIVSGAAQTGSVKVSARGGFQLIGTDGEAAGSISGEIRLSANSAADIMFVLKDVGGATVDGQSEAIIFLKSIDHSKVVGNKMVLSGLGTFQGEQRTVEITIIDAQKRTDKDQIRVRVLRAGHVDFDRSARLDSSAIVITRQ
jgi:hypothetical protein